MSSVIRGKWLAALCLARQAEALDQNGMAYTDDNIGGLLQARHQSRKTLRAGGRIKGPAKRTPGQDAAFEKALEHMLQSLEGRQAGLT